MIASPRFRPGLFVAAAAATLLASSGAYALPIGGTVAASTAPGSATISVTGSTETINQSADRVIIDWTNFDIAPGETVTFNQPSNTSIAFNRVRAGEAANIDGNLSGNGGVFLFADGGVFFGDNAVVNVGSLLASAVMLDPVDYNLVLNNNRVLLRTPVSLALNNPFPEVNLSAGAQVHANAGEALLIAPTINMAGTLSAAKSVTYIAAEGAQIDYTLTGTGLQEAPLGTIIQWVVGRGRIGVSSPGTVTAGGGFIVNTPSPVLEDAYTNVINLDGQVFANGFIAGSSDSVQLFASGPTPPGFNGNVLTSPGSGPINFDLTGGGIEAAHDVRFSVEQITFGDLLVSGNFSGQSYEDIVFSAPASVTGNINVSNGNGLRFGNNGVGDVIINADMSSGGSLGLDTNGDVIFAPGVEINSGSTLLWGPIGQPVGVRSTTIGAGTVLTSVNTLAWNGQGGPTTIGAGASLTSSSGSISGGGTTLNVGQNASLVASNALVMNFTGLMTLGVGSQLTSQHNGRALPDYWPITVYRNSLVGGVYLRASDIVLNGTVTALEGAGPGEIFLDAAPAASQIEVGGPDQAPAAGVFRLSNPEFQRLHGAVVIWGSAFVRPSGASINIHDLSIDGAVTPFLNLYTFGPNDVTVDGVVQSVGAARPDFRIGTFAILDNATAQDNWASVIPRDVLITGSLGTADHPLGFVGLAATGDILMGTSDYVNAVRQTPSFDPRAPNTLSLPAPGHLFVASDTLGMAAMRRIFQQNSSTTPQYSGILINAPDADHNLMGSPDWAARVADSGQSFSFGSNGSPVFPDFSAGPTAVNLYGVFKNGNVNITGPALIENDFLVIRIDLAPEYYINDCSVRGCPSSGSSAQYTDSLVEAADAGDDFDFGDDSDDDSDMAAADADPDAEDYMDPDDEEDVSELDELEAELLADFIRVPGTDRDAQRERLNQSVTGAGNGDLWTPPPPETH